MSRIKLSYFLVFIFSICSIFSLDAQLKLPQASPKASVSYTVGLTEVAIHYSSPAVKERKIWGDLVPYAEVWRAGANDATTIEFTTDVLLEGEELKAGKYAFFLIPATGDDAGWTAIFNTVHDQWGAYDYDKEKDVLRVDIKVKDSNINVERLTYSIHDQDVDKGYIKLAWEKKRVYLRFNVKLMDQAMTNINKAIEEADPKKKWMVLNQGAQFLLEQEENLDLALEWSRQSTDLYSHSWNWYVKAQLQAKKGMYREALQSATKSHNFGVKEKDKYFKNSKEEILASLKEYKAKL